MYRDLAVELSHRDLELWLMILLLIVLGLVILRFCGVLAIVSVFSLILILFLFQNNLLYANNVPGSSHSPSGNQVGYRHPSERNLPTHDVTLVTDDNVTIRGWLVYRKKNSRLIIYFHQNAQNLGFRITFIQNLFLKTDSDVLLVAYRGYSDSEGVPTERGLQLDSLAIIRYAVKYRAESITKGYNKDIYVYGCSLGGAVAIYAISASAYKSLMKGLIIQNTFTSFPKILKVLFPYFSILSILSKNKWNSIDRMRSIKNPILFIRSLKDKLIPPIQMLELFQAAKNSIFRQDYRIHEGGHNGAWLVNPSNYFAHLNAFFSKIENR